MLLIENLIPTHNEVRDPPSIARFLEMLREGKNYKEQSRPISINDFGDGLLYVRDGHRRLCAAMLTGKNTLEEGEYEVERYTYENYARPNPANGWFTPFDPRESCRLADFGEFKQEVMQRYRELSNRLDFPLSINYTSLNQFIRENTHRYVEPRRLHTFDELVSQVKDMKF